MSIRKLITLSILIITTSLGHTQDSIQLEAFPLKDKIDHTGFRVPGKDGYAWDFYHHPKIQRVSESCALGENYTVTIWFKLADTSGKSALLSSPAWRRFLLMIESGRSITLRQYGRSSLSVDYKLDAGRWYQLAVAANRTETSIYLDGILLGTKVAKKSIKKIPINNISVIGAYYINPHGAVDYFFKGLIDKPVFYNKTLSELQIRNDYLASTQTIKIIPMPQQVDFKKGVTAKFNTASGLDVELTTPMLSSGDIGFEWLGKVLDGKLNFKTGSSSNKLVLWDYKNKRCPAYLKAKIDGNFPDEGYVLSIGEKQIDLAAVTSRGLFYGLMTLTEMFKQKKQWQQLTVFDYPTFAFRCGMYVDDNQPPINFDSNLNNYIIEMARYKVRYFMPRTHDWFDLDSPKTAVAVVKLNKLLQKYHIELIPYLQCYGHAKGPQWKDIKTGHTKTIPDEEYIVGKSLTVLKSNNVIRTPRTPIIVKTAAGLILSAGKDYTVINGQLQTEWNWPKEANCRHGWAKPYIRKDNEPFKIEWKGVRPGTKVLITYDIAAGTEGTCPMQPEYRDLLRYSLEKTIALVNPSIINIGMDEIWSPKGAGRCCGQSELTPGQMIVFEIQRTFEVIKSINPKTDVMFFSDMLDPSQTPYWKSTYDLSSLKEGKLSREIIQMPWGYSDQSSIKGFAEGTLEWALKYSDRVVGVSGHRFANILAWTYESLKYQPSGKSPGVLFTRWASVPKTAAAVGYEAYAQSMWSPDYLMIPKMLEVYWTITEMGLDEKSTDADVATLIVILKKAPSSVIKISKLRVLLVEAEVEMELMKNRTGFNQLKIVTDSIERAKMIVKGYPKSSGSAASPTELSEQRDATACVTKI